MNPPTLWSDAPGAVPWMPVKTMSSRAKCLDWRPTLPLPGKVKSRGKGLVNLLFPALLFQHCPGTSGSAPRWGLGIPDAEVVPTQSLQSPANSRRGTWVKISLLLSALCWVWPGHHVTIEERVHKSAWRWEKEDYIEICAHPHCLTQKR